MRSHDLGLFLEPYPTVENDYIVRTRKSDVVTIDKGEGPLGPPSGDIKVGQAPHKKGGALKQEERE